MSRTNGAGGRPVAFDLPWDASPMVLDLTEARFERVHSGGATPEEELRYFHEVVKPAWDARRSAGSDAGELYEQVLADLSESGAAADTADDDSMYRAFVEQSGMADMLGMSAARAADLTAGVAAEDGKVDASEGADMSEEQMWSAFVEATGFEEAAPPPPAGGSADLAEDDEGSSLSDEEAWQQYVEATGGLS